MQTLQLATVMALAMNSIYGKYGRSDNMEVTMRTLTLARMLRKRLAVLKAERKKALKKYDRDFAQWKLALAKWFRTEPATKVAQITKSDMNNSRYGYRSNGIPDWLFKDMPQPPSKPKDEAIKEVQKAIRYLAITGTATVTPSQSQVDKWFGTEEEDED